MYTYSTVSWVLMLKKERKREGSRFVSVGRKERKEEGKNPGKPPPSQKKNQARKGSGHVNSLTRSVLSDHPRPSFPLSFFLFFGPFPFLPPSHQERFFIPSVLLRFPDREIWSYWRSRGNKNGGFISIVFSALLRYYNSLGSRWKARYAVCYVRFQPLVELFFSLSFLSRVGDGVLMVSSVFRYFILLQLHRCCRY